MSLIGNTAGLSYLVSGLNASTTYWFGVSAKNGTVNGRRSVSKSALPSTEFAPWRFHNNFKAVSIDAPVTGRQFTSSSLGATESIKLTFRNLDNVASSGIYNLSYQVNSDPVVTESGSAVIAALGSLQYTFTQIANFSARHLYHQGLGETCGK